MAHRRAGPEAQADTPHTHTHTQGVCADHQRGFQRLSSGVPLDKERGSCWVKGGLLNVWGAPFGAVLGSMVQGEWGVWSPVPEESVGVRRW